jgi:hypothetical protein
MPFASQNKNFRAAFAKQLPKLKLLGLNLLLGAGASTFCFTNSASAAESIILIYNETLTSTSITDIQAFASRGEMTKDLQEFFQRTPQAPEVVRNLLTARIPLSQTLVERNFRNSTGQFLLIQLDKLLSTAFRQEKLEPLRSALVAAYGDDNRLSVLELIEEYPESEIRIDLRSLEKVYHDVSNFITRIQPLLAVTKELLPELVCECESPSTASETDSSQTKLSDLVVSADGIGSELPARIPSCSNALDRFSNRAESEAIAAPGTGASAKALHNSVTIVEPGEASVVLLLGASAGAALAATPTPATKQLVLTFGPLSGSLFVRELETFAETGQVPSSVGFYLKLAKVKPEDFRQVLTQEMNVSAKFLDNTLNSLLGEYLLFQVGQVVYTRSRRANIQALRAALVLSAIGDNRISLLEFLQKYPNQQVYVNGVKLARVGRFAKRGLEGVEDLLVEVQASLADRACNCQSD